MIRSGKGLIVTDVTFAFDTYRADPDKSPEYLIVLLHGIGGNKARLEKTAEMFAKGIPDSAVVVPEAPFPHLPKEARIGKIKDYASDRMSERSQSWCEMGLTLPLRIAFNRLQVVNDLNRFIDSRLKDYGLDDSRLVLFGFSQGGGMALHSALKRTRPCAAVIAHSAPFFGLTGAKVRPPVLMLIGEKDIQTIDNLKGPGNWLTAFLFSHRRSLERLAERGIGAEEKIVPGLGHKITDETRDIAVDFARKKLGL